MYEVELQRILDASKNNALTFFVGAGVSALSHAPNWKTLIDTICDELGRPRKEEYSSDEYLQIPQMFFYSINKNQKKYLKFVEEKIQSEELSPNIIHREMLRLNPASFITTNYDSLLENAASDYCQSYKVISCDNDVPTIFGDKYILKIHGDFQSENIVLKEEDYLNYSDNFKLIETLVKSIFATNTVVFIGYSLNDYNIKMILNWTKTLLKDRFRNPLFFHSSNKQLSQEELLYHQSRGLSVIESRKWIDSEEYLPRYRVLFDSIRKQSSFSLEGKSEDEAFLMLYNLLASLDSLQALRVEDVSKRLRPYVHIEDDGIILSSPKDCILIKKFFDIHGLSIAEQNDLPYDVQSKYLTIVSVLKKARINRFEENFRIECFINDGSFADLNCISFHFAEMHRFCLKEYNKYQTNYKKAFYLSRLCRFDEAFFLFNDVATKSFKEKDYLIYYFAESNCIRLRRVIDNLQQLYHCYNIDKIESILSLDTEFENVFERLPTEFKSANENLKDIHSVNLLYRYSYEAFVASQKMQHAFDSDSIEFGLTSSNKAICRINDYLHFFLGNGIVCDIFSEYKTTVKNLMSQLIHKCAIQEKKRMNPTFFDNSSDKVSFDEVDFYCIVTCFNEKEIRIVLEKNEIKTLVFQNRERIELAVNNLIGFYEQDIKNEHHFINRNDLEYKIKSMLMLLRYMDISQDLVDRVCEFILSYEFNHIYINDKILFLDRQLERRKRYSTNTSKVIEDKLIDYIDKNISAFMKNESFSLFSTNSDIGYANLVYYISPNQVYQSHRLSIRINKILHNSISDLYSDIANYYYDYVSKYQKAQITAWAKRKINDKFDMELFLILVKGTSSVEVKSYDSLISFLKEDIKRKTKKDVNGVFVDNGRDKFSELNQVGVWCFLGAIKKVYFKEFLGHSALFDFFFEYTKFDFSKFEVSWLLRFPTHVLEKISEKKTVKNKIRGLIKGVLEKRSINDSEYRRLQTILVEYFC